MKSRSSPKNKQKFTTLFGVPIAYFESQLCSGNFLLVAMCERVEGHLELK